MAAPPKTWRQRETRSGSTTRSTSGSGTSRGNGRRSHVAPLHHRKDHLHHLDRQSYAVGGRGPPRHAQEKRLNPCDGALWVQWCKSVVPHRVHVVKNPVGLVNCTGVSMSPKNRALDRKRVHAPAGRGVTLVTWGNTDNVDGRLTRVLPSVVHRPDTWCNCEYKAIPGPSCCAPCTSPPLDRR